MAAIRAVWFSIVVALLFLIPVAPTADTPSDGTAPAALPKGESAIVRIHVPEARAGALGPEVEVVERYDTFVLARATEDAIARLSQRGVTVVPEDTFTLHVNGYAFDTREPVRVPRVLEAAPLVEGFGYEIVQFAGPVKEEWKWALEATGARIVAYVPNNAFVVRASPAQLASLKALPHVQWTGPHHPAFRIAPELLAAEGAVAVKVITFGGEPVGPVVATLAKLGYRYIGRWAQGEGIRSFADYETFGLVRATIDAADLVPLARLRGVRYLEPELEMRPANQQEQFVLQTNATADGAGVRRLWDMGLRGELQRIALADTGLDYDHSSFRQSSTVIVNGDIYNVTDATRRKVIRYLPMSGFVGVDPFTGGDPNAIKDSPEGFCGSGHGTATSGAAAGDDTGIASSLNDGMAPNAKLVMLDIGSVDTTACNDVLRYIPDDYGDMFGSAYAAPTNARIFSNSWGSSSSAYTLEASNTDRFIWNNPDALILFANGNNPPNPTVGSPATAKNVVSVGAAATWNNREAVGGVSRGPTADGRRKPDISTIFSTVSPGGTAASDGDLTTRNTGDTGFAGTSYATPLAAGMAALARQYYFEGWYPRGVKNGDPAVVPSAALLKATLAVSSVQMIGSGACPAGDAFYPNIAQGWGRLWLDEALYFAGDPKKLFVVDHRNGIYTGDTLEYRVRVATANGRFRAMLAWSDAPALEGANPALVNNLDLEVVDPTGATYRGNVRGSCAAGQSVTGGSFDTLNNLEGVYRRTPATGEWRIRVIGANVPVGPQRFALVVLADLDQAYGTVEIDKTLYNEADTINIQVIDGDATGASVSVTVTSTTEPAGETRTLNRVVTPNGIVFRGTISTNYGVPAADGMIQVSHLDTVTVTYNDNSPPHAAEARARIELDPPAISNVRVSGVSNAAATITWTTDKPSDSTVFYGTTPSLGSTRADSAQVLSHSVTLTGLTGDTLYYFDVASARVGRQTRDANGGLHYRFQTTGGAEILLVITEGSFTAERLDMYRNALASAGWSWNEWDVDRQGDPTLATLQGYKAVLWQAGLEQYPPLRDNHAAMLRQYVDGGGRIMFSGHDFGWSACDGGSPYGSPARCSFVQSIMKADYVSDPSTFSQEIGRATDAISDGYQVGGPIGPQTYVPHRSGGAGDEVNTFNAGGTTTNVWQTNTGDAPPWDGIKWVSSGNNGTCPGGIWCNTPSRVASYFFEFTGINYVAGVPGNPARTDILNKTIVFLLGRNPPVVRVSSPNGGETITSSPMTVTWQRSQPLSAQEIWVSDDYGASWTKVKDVATTAASDPVDISTWRNGCGYLIRVVVRDTGTPQLTAQDASDGTFCIERPGGDPDGPLVRPGSVRVFPNPVRAGQTVSVNATVDDTLRGNSDIVAAEFFVQPTEPTVAEYGTGTAMAAADGAFDAPSEDVRATTTATWPDGSTQVLWIHGRDAAGNWGGFWAGNRSFLVIAASTVPPPNPPTDVRAALTGAGFGTVRITWAYSGPAVDKFQVYFGTSYDATGGSYALLQDNIAPSTLSFDHVGAGSGDPTSYFYYVRAVNLGGSANSATQAAKFTRSLSGGWNLVSVPVLQTDPSIAATLQTMSWRTARTYVAGAADPWKAAYSAGRSGDLQSVTVGMALWVDLAAADDFTVAGQVPASTTITLVPGWNFVGYASFLPANAATSFTGLGVTQLEGYSPAPQYYLQRLPIATTTLSAGQGYWVYTATGGAWTVTN